MLSPDDRAVSLELLRPPPEYSLDRAVLTTFTLDLEALLLLPMAILSHDHRDPDALLEDPLLLLEGLREIGDRLTVFYEADAIHAPARHRALFGLLDDCVHPARAPRGGAFHPKLWVLRFTAPDRPVRIRVGVMSRNLTFDRSWDVALATEGSPKRRRVEASDELAKLLKALPGMSEGFPGGLRQELEALASEVKKTRFSAPEGFDDEPVRFYASGWRKRHKGWSPPDLSGLRLLAISPYLSEEAIRGLAGWCRRGDRILLSREEALDAIPEDALEGWQTFVLSDAALDEDEDRQPGLEPEGLHAKAIAIEHGWKASWWMGSANLTEPGWSGRNVELMAELRGGKSGRRGVGIVEFWDPDGDRRSFRDLCTPYRRVEREAEPEEVAAARKSIEKAKRRLGRAGLRVKCDAEGEGWRLSVEGEVDLPADVEVTAWPVTLKSASARPMPGARFSELPTARLTALFAFSIRARDVPDAGEVRFAMKLGAVGFPDDRIAHVLRALIETPRDLFRYLRALLGGLEGGVGGGRGGGGGDGEGDGGFGLGEELLEDLLRAASREPARLRPIRRLIADLQSTPEGRAMLPDAFLALWQVFETLTPTEAR